jgi:hypothetical protein
MAAATAGFVLLLALQHRDRHGGRVLGQAILSGLLMAVALLTKETYATVTVLPVLVLLATGRGLRRRTAATVLATVLAIYAAYVLALLLAGQGDLWLEQKTSGVRRLLGLSQITGFNREGSVGFLERILANPALSRGIGHRACRIAEGCS